MTIAAGLPCNEGLVICADTQETIIGFAKTNTDKVTVLQMPDYNIVFTGSTNSTGLIEMAVQEMLYEIAGEKPPGIPQLYAIFKRVNLRIFNEQSIAYSSLPDERPFMDLLIGIQFDNDTYLYKISGTTVRYCKESECVGSGLALAKSLIAQFWDRSMTLQETWIVALYVLYQCKEWVDGCGGNSDIILLSNHNRALTRIPTVDVQSLELHFETFASSIRPILVSCANSSVTPTQFDDLMRAFKIQILALRGKFMDHEEFWRRLGEEAGITLPLSPTGPSETQE